MGTTTELNRVVPDSDYANFLTVFLTKEGHSSHFFSSIDICFNRFDCDRFPNLFIDLLLNSTQFFWSHSLEVSKVKAKEFYFVKRSCLGCMVTKDIVKSRMEQVSCSVVLHNTMTTIGIDRQGVFLVQGKRGKNFNSMKWLSIWCFLNICYCSNDISCSIQDLTMVRNLSTHFSVEWSFCKDQ